MGGGQVGHGEKVLPSLGSRLWNRLEESPKGSEISAVQEASAQSSQTHRLVSGCRLVLAAPWTRGVPSPVPLMAPHPGDAVSGLAANRNAAPREAMLNPFSFKLLEHEQLFLSS